jgi:hypothetical protein
MNLTTHAENELRLAGLLDEDSDYNGMLGQAVLELVKVFSNQGHSGFSASATASLFNELAGYGNITPLTNNPNEWLQHENNLWQSRRNSAAFSNTGGTTYYFTSEKGKLYDSAADESMTCSDESVA